MAVYDYPGRQCTITAAVPHGWAGLELDRHASDPAGNFCAFLTRDISSETTSWHAQVVLTLNDIGAPVQAHPDFDLGLIGSMTIWPYEVAGKRRGLDRFVWWSQGSLWLTQDGPRPWGSAVG